MEVLEHSDGFLCSQCRDGIYHGADVRQTAAFCFFYPCIGVTVSVEDNSLMFRAVGLDQIMDCHIKVFRIFQNLAGFLESFCHDGVQHNIWCCHGILRSYHTELKFVSGKGKR